MLTGLYGYIFGAEDSNESQVSQEIENQEPSTMEDQKMEEGDWCLVDECNSGRSSPVLIPLPEMRDIDTLSFASKKSTVTAPPSADSIRKSEELRQAKAQAAHRLQLERVLFSDAPLSLKEPLATKSKNSLLSAAKLKRASANCITQSDQKTKTRSKKAGKLSSGMNNDRKVNNLD